MALIIQGYVDARICGHLSNERRVSRRVTDWTWEYEYSKRESLATTERIVIRRSRQAAANDIDLACGTTNQLHLRLREIATACSKLSKRRHFEWLWDGKRIWVVQCDEEEEIVSPKPGSVFAVRDLSFPFRSFKTLKPAFDTVRRWPKAECIALFRDCALPYGKVFVLENEEILRGLGEGTVAHSLREDLTDLMRVPIVIRSDVSKESKKPGLLLPRTDAVSSVQIAEDWLRKTALTLTEQGLPPNSFCFLLHRVIPATTGVFAYSRPGVSRVRIDSLWGSPDGLGYFAHDSFDVDIEKKKVLGSHLRCKTHYVDLDAKGDWADVANGRPWDWRPSLNKDELTTVASYAHSIAAKVGTAVSVMCFVGVDPRSDLPPCLPWFYTGEVEPEFDPNVTTTRFAGKNFVVSSEEDLSSFKTYFSGSQRNRSVSIRLRPCPQLLRSREFLQGVTDAALVSGAAIELEGSLLSHAYYILRRQGARIRCVDLFEGTTNRQLFGKLVRDRIPLRIVSHGEEPRTYKVTRHELLALLRAKAVEESLELFWEPASSNLIEELADLMEVIEAIYSTVGRTIEEVHQLAEAKKQERGGFEKGIVLVETRATPLIRRQPKEDDLFSDSDDAPPTPSEPDKAGLLRQIVLESRKPRLEGDMLAIPLVPPDVDSLSQKIVIRMADGTQEAVISYDKSIVRVLLRPHTALTPDSRQLTLPFPEN